MLVVMMTEPDVIARRCGGWLATTPSERTIRFGVVGNTRDEAVAAYRLAEVRWTTFVERSKSGEQELDR